MRKLIWLLVPVASAAFLAATAIAAAAGPPLQGSGTATATSFTVTGVRTADGVTFLDFVETDALTGTFAGTSVIDGSCVVRHSGDSACHARETFTGTVNGSPGTVTFDDVIFIDATGAVRGSFAIVDANGGLAGLHGHGTFEGPGGGPATYTATLVFAP